MRIAVPARTIPLALAAGGLLFSGLAQIPAAAAPLAATAETSCTARNVVLELKPGIGLKPSSGSFYGGPGKVTCDGRVLGRKVTGPGAYSSAGRIGTKDPDSCTSGGEGWGVVRLDFPTAKGPLVVTSPVTFTYGAVTKKGLLAGELRGDYVDGVFRILPKKGDCVTSPVTLSTAQLELTIHNYRG